VRSHSDSGSSLTKIRDRLTDARHALRYAFHPPHLILILGMHRSGTSCVTKTLNLLGVSFGRTIVDTRAPDNGEIHWESPIAVWINDEILARSGGTWLDPPGQLHPSHRDIWRCRRFLWEFAGWPLAMFKDPRLVITYPVWRRVLPAHTVIACVRNPMGVARSLQSRDALPIQQGIALWKDYNQRLLNHLSDDPDVLWFDFDGGKPSVVSLVNPVAARFSLQPRAEAVSHYDPHAHHHRDGDELPRALADLYNRLRRRCNLLRPDTTQQYLETREP
jgi:hypothetical protein